MESPRLHFANNSTPARKAAPAKPVPLIWTFNPSLGMDAPFHHLASLFGQEIIMDMDEIVLDTPRQAVVRTWPAVKVWQYSR